MSFRQNLATGLGLVITALLAITGLMALLFPIGFRADLNWWSPFLLGLSGLLYLGILGLIYRGLTRAAPRQNRWLAGGLWTLLLLIQLWVAINWVPAPKADLYFVHQQALDLLNGNQHWNAYFQTYPNNVNITVLLSGLLKLGRWFTGGTDSGVWLNLVQFAWLDLGIAVLARHLRHQAPARANLFLTLALTCIPFYAYALNTYSDILVLPIGLFVVVASSHLRHATSWAAWWRWGTLLSFLLTLAFLLKANFVVLIIAVLLILWALPVRLTHAWRAKLGVTLLLGGILLTGLAGNQALDRAVGFRSDPNQALPAISWIAMSWNPDYHGEYVRADANMVIAQPTARTKQTLAHSNLSDYLTILGPLGVANHLAKKYQLLLATGTFDAFQVNSAFHQEPNWYRQHQYATNWLLANFAQISYISFLLITTLWGWAQWRQKQFQPSFLLGGLFALGLVAFHVIFWESEERYALPLLPLLLAGTAAGFRLPERRPLTRRTHWLLTIGGVSLLAIALGWGAVTMTQPVGQSIDVVSQNEGRYYQNNLLTLRRGQSLTQPFEAPAQFNRIEVDASSEPVRVGQLTLRRNGRIVWQSRPNAHIQEQRFTPQPAGHYQLTVTNHRRQDLNLLYAPATYPLIPQAIVGHPDRYLRFEVNRTVRTPFMTPAQFTLFAILITLLTSGLLVLCRWWWPLKTKKLP